MKFFIYKSLIICLLFFLVFHLTFGYAIRSYKNEFFNTFSKDKVDYVKEVLRSEIKEINEKENIFYPEDAELLGEFIKKILNELNKSR